MAAFLDGRIAWIAIPDVLTEALSRHDGGTADGVEAVIEADAAARAVARTVIAERSPRDRHPRRPASSPSAPPGPRASIVGIDWQPRRCSSSASWPSGVVRRRRLARHDRRPRRHDLPARARPLPHRQVGRHEGHRVLPLLRPEDLVVPAGRDRVRHQAHPARRLRAHHRDEQPRDRRAARGRAPHLPAAVVPASGCSSCRPARSCTSSRPSCCSSSCFSVVGVPGGSRSPSGSAARGRRAGVDRRQRRRRPGADAAGLGSATTSSASTASRHHLRRRRHRRRAQPGRRRSSSWSSATASSSELEATLGESPNDPEPGLPRHRSRPIPSCPTVRVNPSAASSSPASITVEAHGPDGHRPGRRSSPAASTTSPPTSPTAARAAPRSCQHRLRRRPAPTEDDQTGSCRSSASPASARAVRRRPRRLPHPHGVVNVLIGILNLMPLLPLDGGHVAIATYERIRSIGGRRYMADVVPAAAAHLRRVRGHDAARRVGDLPRHRRSHRLTRSPMELGESSFPRRTTRQVMVGNGAGGRRRADHACSR